MFEKGSEELPGKLGLFLFSNNILADLIINCLFGPGRSICEGRNPVLSCLLLNPLHPSGKVLSHHKAHGVSECGGEN